jgi:hypothetical protein
MTTIWFLGVIVKNFTFPSSMGLVGAAASVTFVAWFCHRVSDLIQSSINSLMVSFVGFLLVHTCLFHGYMNLVSELIKFADRDFYHVCW